MQPIPYASPGVPANGMRCPRCQANAAFPSQFTWWGGLIGPKLLSHAVCKACGYGFNTKTGKSNTPGIILYTVSLGVIGLLLLLLMFLR